MLNAAQHKVKVTNMKDKDSQLIWEQYKSPGREGDPKKSIPFPDGRGEMGEREAGVYDEIRPPLSSADELMDLSLRSLEKGDLWKGSEYVHLPSNDDDALGRELKKIPDIDEHGVYIMMYHIKTPEGDYVNDDTIAFVVDDRYADENQYPEFLGAVIFDSGTLEQIQPLDGTTAEQIAKQHKLYIEEELPEPEREPDYDIEPDYRRGLGGDYI